jgi:CBS domain-containing protein
MNATVRSVMTKRVIALKRNADFKEIAAVLRQYRVSACPVITDDGAVIGVVSEADLLFKLADPSLPSGLIRLRWKLGEESKVTAVTAGQLMTAPAVTISPGVSVVEAARLMQDRRVKRLPVVDHRGKLIGIVSRADVLSVYARPDEEIRDEVLDVIIASEFALDPGNFQVSVKSGVLTLTGLVERTDIALRLVARIRHAEGVVFTRDRLSVRDAGTASGPVLAPRPAADNLAAKGPLASG